MTSANKVDFQKIVANIWIDHLDKYLKLSEEIHNRELFSEALSPLESLEETLNNPAMMKLSESIGNETNFAERMESLKDINTMMSALINGQLFHDLARYI